MTSPASSSRRYRGCSAFDGAPSNRELSTRSVTDTALDYIPEYLMVWYLLLVLPEGELGHDCRHRADQGRHRDR